MKNEKESTLKVGGAAYTQVLTDGILDVDLCEPSIPRMRKKIIHQTQYSSGKNHTSGSFYQICIGMIE
ncbi:hypothetical protein ACROYT_G030589 [Oculina patagonica]